MPKTFRAQDTKNRQGSTDEDRGHMPTYSYFLSKDSAVKTIREVYEGHMLEQEEIYRVLQEAGVAKEIARGVLGTAFYTQFVWTINARSLMNFLILRCEKHAQWEIRQYAFSLLDIFREKMPWTHTSLITLFPSSFEV